jgi:hypothetical protein
LVVLFFLVCMLEIDVFWEQENQLYTFFYELRKTSNVHSLIWVGCADVELNKWFVSGKSTTNKWMLLPNHK